MNFNKAEDRANRCKEHLLAFFMPGSEVCR
nr:MAG TPA: protein of unknown function (DUF5437) [Caudoviricetes sp.]